MVEAAKFQIAFVQVKEFGHDKGINLTESFFGREFSKLLWGINSHLIDKMARSLFRHCWASSISLKEQCLYGLL